MRNQGYSSGSVFTSTIPPARFLLSKSKVLETYDRIRSISDIVSYSFKTNSKVGKVLEEKTNSMFSIHTMNSLSMIDDDNKSRVWFFAQGWDENDIKSLTNQGVDSFVVDNVNDLNTLTSYLKDNHDKKLNLLLRMKLREHTIHTGKYFVYGFYSDDINRLIPKLRSSRHIGKLGIHFHRKTQNVGEWQLKEEISELLSEKTLNAIDYVNIGGGMPSEYKNYNLGIINGIFDRIKKFKDWLNENDVEMIIEPGRFIAAPSVKLETYVKTVYGNGRKKNVIVNCSVYNTFMDTIIFNLRLLIDDEIREVPGRDVSGVRRTYEYTIKGETPDSYDIFRYRVILPRELKRGDKITFLNAGAYNYHTDFCNLPVIKTYIID